MLVIWRPVIYRSEGNGTYRMYDMPDVVEESCCFEDFDIQRGKEERKELYLQALKQ